jgi:hypothetical protein
LRDLLTEVPKIAEYGFESNSNSPSIIHQL